MLCQVNVNVSESFVAYKEKERNTAIICKCVENIFCWNLFYIVLCDMNDVRAGKDRDMFYSRIATSPAKGNTSTSISSVQT